MFSSAFANSPTRILPVVDMSQQFLNMYSKRGQPCAYYPETGYPVESYGQSCIRFFDLMGFCPVGIATTDSNGGNYYNPNVFPYQN